MVKIIKKKPSSSFPEPRYIVDETGKKVEVVLGIKAYDQLMEILEDYYLVKIAEDAMSSESKSDYTDLADIRDSLLKE